MTKRMTIFYSIASASFILALAVAAGFIIMNSGYHSKSSLEETNKIAESNESFVIYLAKDSCSDCEQVDQRMILNQFKLKYSLYRIEVTKEKDQTELKKMIKENDVKKVPTFLLIEGKSIKIIQENELF